MGCKFAGEQVSKGMMGNDSLLLHYVPTVPHKNGKIRIKKPRGTLLQLIKEDQSVNFSQICICKSKYIPYTFTFLISQPVNLHITVYSRKILYIIFMPNSYLYVYFSYIYYILISCTYHFLHLSGKT